MRGRAPVVSGQRQADSDSDACRAIQDKKAAVPAIKVVLTGLGKPVPVYTDAAVVDFKVHQQHNILLHVLLDDR